MRLCSDVFPECCIVLLAILWNLARRVHNPSIANASRRLLLQSEVIRAHAGEVERLTKPRINVSDHFPLFVNSSNAEKSPSSIFFQTASIRALRSRPVSRFFVLFFPLSLDRHLLTSRFMSLQPPKALKRKPRAWHSSRAFMISVQPTRRSTV